MPLCYCWEIPWLILQIEFVHCLSYTLSSYHLNGISKRLYCFEPCEIMLHYILYEVGFFRGGGGGRGWLSFCSCSFMFSSLFIISGFEILSEIKSFIYGGWFSEKCKDFKALTCFFPSCLIVLNV